MWLRVQCLWCAKSLTFCLFVHQFPVPDPQFVVVSSSDVGSIPALGRSPGEGNGYTLQYSCLGNPKARGAWWATVHGSQTVGQNWATEQVIRWLFKQLSKITIWSCNSTSGGIPRRSKGRDSRKYLYTHISVSSVTQPCPTLCDPMACSTPGFPVHHQLLEATQTHVHQVTDAIQPSHPLSSPSPPAFDLSQRQGLFQWVSSSHQEAELLDSASASVLPMNIQDWFPLYSSIIHNRQEKNRGSNPSVHGWMNGKAKCGTGR